MKYKKIFVDLSVHFEKNLMTPEQFAEQEDLTVAEAEAFLKLVTGVGERVKVESELESNKS